MTAFSSSTNVSKTNVPYIPYPPYPAILIRPVRSGHRRAERQSQRLTSPLCPPMAWTYRPYGALVFKTFVEEENAVIYGFIQLIQAYSWHTLIKKNIEHRLTVFPLNVWVIILFIDRAMKNDLLHCFYHFFLINLNTCLLDLQILSSDYCGYLYGFDYFSE